MIPLHQQFLEIYIRTQSTRTVFTDKFPDEMKASEEDEDGWIGWKPLPGTLTEKDYHSLEAEFGVQFPKSFIDWHKANYFLDADLGLLRLPESNPRFPLEDLRDELNWYIPQQLIPQKLFPFASDGNDTGPLVFDAREPRPFNEFPIRVYDHEAGGDISGLSPVIFSSFTKLLECMNHFMRETETRQKFKIIPDFFQIDPSGAGSTGLEHWQTWIYMYSED